jgi:hypothetical protein
MKRISIATLLCALAVAAMAPLSVKACDPFAKPPDTSISTVVRYAYCVVLDRDPDAAGKTYWENKVRNGLTYRDLLLQMFEGDEIQKSTGVGAMDDPQWVDFLYHRLFRREPDLGGRENWINERKKGRSRWDIVRWWFHESPEFRQHYPIFWASTSTNGRCCWVTIACGTRQNPNQYCDLFTCPCPYARMNYQSVRGRRRTLSASQKRKARPIVLPAIK